MNPKKNFLKSMTIWGCLLLIFQTTVTKLGYNADVSGFEAIMEIAVPAALVLIGRYRKGDITLGASKPEWFDLPDRSSTLAVAVLALGFTLGGCATAQPVQAQKDTAGTSDVQQSEYNEVQRTNLPSSIVYTFNGDVGNVVLMDQSITGNRDGDVGAGVTNQGSTTTETAKTGSQEGGARGGGDGNSATIPVK
jgi:hypothetical protein